MDKHTCFRDLRGLPTRQKLPLDINTITSFTSSVWLGHSQNIRFQLILLKVKRYLSDIRKMEE
jgi:hypothetical protein